MTTSRKYEHGATAIIVVIFSILVMMVISVGFIRLIIQDQNRTVESTLSRGAYDAALAGVEDAKRVLQICSLSPTHPACKAIDARKCSTPSDAGLVTSQKGEVLIKRVASSDSVADTFDQAYTCVKVQTKTDDFVGKIDQGQSNTIPLNSDKPFGQVTFSWFMPKAGEKVAIQKPFPFNPTPLVPLNEWADGKIAPSLIKAQLITYDKSGFALEDLDRPADSGKTGARTLYLYPSSSGTRNMAFNADTRTGDTRNHFRAVSCNLNIVNTYACSVTLDLPGQIGGDLNMQGYLRISSFYGASKMDYKVVLNGAKFDNVQPVVDSTGRANDIFRRVQARVKFESGIDISPRAAVDISGNLCKDFSISANGFNEGECNKD